MKYAYPAVRPMLWATARYFLFVLLALHSIAGRAQLAREQAPALRSFTCETPSHGQNNARVQITGYAPYGHDLTMAGDLRVLVVFAGFTEDLNPGAPNYNDANWPQTDATHPVAGTTFPVNYNAQFYDNFTQFSPTATDKTLSNFYYQMSRLRSSMAPFRMVAQYFPERINVPSNNDDWSGCNTKVFQAINNNPAYRNYAWNTVDSRQNAPAYQVDTSVLPADHKIDYVIVVWRSTGAAPYTRYYPTSGGAFSSLGPYLDLNYNYPQFFTFSPNSANETYSVREGFTHSVGMAGINVPMFIHEFSHGVYDAQHVNGNNGVVGPYFYSGHCITLMSNDWNFMYTANAWERWYNGWIELTTGANHTPSNIQSSSDLVNANGVYTLRDFATTGDAMRIKIPGTYDAALAKDQYLWLENHANGGSPFNQRYSWTTGGDGLPFPSPSLGMYAFVEKMRANRNQVEGFFDGSGANGFKMLAASGQYDYVHDNNPGLYGGHLWDNWLANFTGRIANPASPQNEVALIREDWTFGKNSAQPQDGVIGYNPGINSGSGNEYKPVIRFNGAFLDGMFGPSMGFTQAGQKLGLGSNPMITPLQAYDAGTYQLEPINLNGLSVEVLSVAANGDVTVRVRYDDADLTQNTRWTGNLVVSDTQPFADVNVKAVLTINKSGTANRHTPTTAQDFVNPTTVRCAAGAYFNVDGTGTVSVEGAGTAFQVDNGGYVNQSGLFVVKSGAVLDIRNGGQFSMYQSTVRIEPGGTLLVRSGGSLQGSGLVQVQAGAYLCIESGAVLDQNSTQAYTTLDVNAAALLGANPALNLGPLNCSGQLRFCGKLTGNHPGLSSVCPTANEALLFDGVDDVVTIPNNNSYINYLGQTFTLEASLRNDRPANAGGSNQTIFSNRDFNGQGALFTIYAGQYLLLQLQGYNYYDLNDPLMRIAPGSGCHQVAVSRDSNNRLHFYVDGQEAAYSPTTTRSPYSAAAIRLGGDAPVAPSESFQGQIGEVRVWNSTRSTAEIQRYLAAPLTPTPQYGLVGYYDVSDWYNLQVVHDGSGIDQYGYTRADGVLGTSQASEATDPAWVTGAQLTCTVSGNFRATRGGPTLPDTLGRAAQRTLVSPAQVGRLAIVPNPAAGRATLLFEQKVTGPLNVRIADVLGRNHRVVVRDEVRPAGPQRIELPLQGLASGVYTVVVRTASGQEHIRLQIE